MEWPNWLYLAPLPEEWKWKTIVVTRIQDHEGISYREVGRLDGASIAGLFLSPPTAVTNAEQTRSYPVEKLTFIPWHTVHQVVLHDE